jgi:hypothetical protein
MMPICQRPARAFIVVLLALMISSTISAQSPFSGAEIEVDRISGIDSIESTESARPGIFQRIRTAIKNGLKHLTSAIKNRNQPGQLPDFISRAISIPGHDTAHFVFQGITVLPHVRNTSNAGKEAFHRYIILSYYPKTDKTRQPSQLVVIDSLTGKAIRRFSLYQAKDKPYTGHAGGITAAGRYLWVASGYKLYGFELQKIIDSVADKKATAGKLPEGMPPSFNLPAQDLIATRVFAVDATASYVSFDGEYLWVGDFVKASDKRYGPVPHHAKNPFKQNTWIAGYRVNTDGMPVSRQKYSFTSDGKTREGHKPDRLIFCRESVQGFAMGKGFVALSISYGPKNSKLAFYKTPTSKNAINHNFKPQGQNKTYSAEAWTLNSDNHITTIELPAGSEDLEFDGHVLYVGFEGASPNYKPRWTKTNPLIKIEDRFYLINPRLIKELKP